MAAAAPQAVPASYLDLPRRRLTCAAGCAPCCDPPRGPLPSGSGVDSTVSGRSAWSGSRRNPPAVPSRALGLNSKFQGLRRLLARCIAASRSVRRAPDLGRRVEDLQRAQALQALLFGGACSRMGGRGCVHDRNGAVHGRARPSAIPGLAGQGLAGSGLGESLSQPFNSSARSRSRRMRCLPPTGPAA